MTTPLGVVVAGTGFGCITHVRALRNAGFDVVWADAGSGGGWLGAHGMDLGPYTCLATAFGELILGHPLPAGPRPATLADGVAGMAVLDAVRRAATERTWVEVER